ncbi:MAG: rhomboid family intramembrane serine protease [Dysgonamonadaceae bacterium]|jgi:membrane associated rhomboid family serine protease|nr:rhomboid family intramembrane serine protease [Dysgonamonadaceae bacterium]
MSNFRNSFMGMLPPATKNLLIINVLVWLAQFVLLRNNIDLSQWFALHYPASQNFNILQPVTYMFLHSPYSIAHVFFNMFAVFMFGRTLEQVWGTKRFLTYYFVTGIGAGLIQLLVTFIRIQVVQADLPPDMIQQVYADGTSLLNSGRNYVDSAMGQLNLLINRPTVGASGAVFGILLAFGMLFPNAQLFIIPIPFPIKAKFFVIGYGLIELVLGVSGVNSGIAHFAHLGGMIFGIFMILYWRKKDRQRGYYYNY